MYAFVTDPLSALYFECNSIAREETKHTLN